MLTLGIVRVSILVATAASMGRISSCKTIQQPSHIYLNKPITQAPLSPFPHLLLAYVLTLTQTR